MNAIPAELRKRDQWVIWRYETRDGDSKPTKVPYRADNPDRRADSTDASSWSSFEVALASWERSGYDGTGYVFAADDPYTGVDLDHCIDAGTGEIHPAATAIVERLASYTERSPSGTGLHVIAAAELHSDRHKTSKTPWSGDFEVYESRRFFTMTGNGSGAITDHQEQLDAVVAEMLPPPPPRQGSTPRANGRVDADDAELMRRAFAASNGARVQALYNGDTSGHGGDDSVADLSLCAHLAFWTGPDPDRIDGLFRRSGLYREKWEREDYRNRTINRALDGCTEFYDWQANGRRGPQSAGSSQAAGEPSSSGAQPSGARPVTSAKDISKARVRWLWQGRLALGYLAVWCGAGDIGKSMFAAWTISELTHGQLPGQFRRHSQSALIVCTEDGRDDMWVPRLEAAGADLERVGFLDYPRGWNLRDGVAWIDRAIDGTDTPLVFVDALMSHMPDARGGENTRSPTFVRAALQPFADLCKTRKVTGLFGLHPRKAGGDTFADVVQESGVFTQLPRLGLLFGYHPDDLELPQDQQRRVILRGKGNVGRNPGALSFRIAERFLDYGDDDPPEVADGVGYITDVQKCDVTERALLSTKSRQEERPLTKVQQAEHLIGMALRDGGWHLAAPIRARLALLKLDHNATVGAAKRNLGVESRQQEGIRNPPWEWRYPHYSSISTAEADSAPSRGGSLEVLTVPPENPPNPNKDGQSRRVSPNERNGDGEGQSPKLGTHRARATVASPPHPPQTHIECAWPDFHGQHHRPHPTTGRVVCQACHPIPETVA